MGIGASLLVALLAIAPGLSDADYRAVVEAEVASMERDSDWLACELVRCFQSKAVADPSQGFLYWASRHWYLVNKHGGTVLLRPNALQASYLERRAAENVILKYRKGGASTIVDALYYWRCRARENQHAFIMAHTLESADELWSRVEFAHQHMRPFLRAPIARSNRKELKFRDNRSHLRVLTAGGRGGGRGADTDALHLSEAAHYPDLNAVLLAAGESLRKDAWLDIESTPNGFDRYRTEYQAAKDPASRRAAHFFPWFHDAENRIALVPGERIVPDVEEAGLASIHGLDPAQIKWRRDKIRHLREAFLQEHPEDDESCFLTSGLPLFNNPSLRELLQVVEARVDEIDLDRPRPRGPRRPSGGAMGTDSGRFRCWVEPVPGHRYVIGVDVAEGLPGRAYSVAGVLDVSTETPEQVAEWHGHVNPFELGREVLPALGYWYNEAKIAVERNNHGHATLAALKDASYPSIYKHRSYDQRAGGHVRKLGWPTDARTRPQMLGDLRECLEAGHMIVRSAEFLKECMAFQAEHQDHDADELDETGGDKTFRDRVFAWGIAWQVRKQPAPVALA